MRLKLFILLISLFSVDINSQVISGKVFDKVTGLPIGNAHVFLNGTSCFTITDDSGGYQLNVGKIINTQLVISHLSYETMVIEHPFENESWIIYLNEKAFEIEEVAVVAKAGRFSRQQRLNAFERQFFGDNKAGKFCKIQNPEDILFSYDEKNSTLSATNLQPVIVENEYLGYRIHCSLTDFRIKYLNSRSLNARNVESVLLKCNAFFIDRTPNNSVMKKRRVEAYKSSSNYFFKNFANKTLDSSNYVIYDYYFQNILDLEHYFEIKDNGLQKVVQVKSMKDNIKTIENVNRFTYPVIPRRTFFLYKNHTYWRFEIPFIPYGRSIYKIT